MHRYDWEYFASTMINLLRGSSGIATAWLGLQTASADFSFWTITASVLAFLGIPLLAGFLTRTVGEKAKGRD
jgi:ACR3 family arsenite efflux pump ArsB